LKDVKNFRSAVPNMHVTVHTTPNIAHGPGQVIDRRLPLLRCKMETIDPHLVVTPPPGSLTTSSGQGSGAGGIGGSSASALSVFTRTGRVTKGEWVQRQSRGTGKGKGSSERSTWAKWASTRFSKRRSLAQS
jgi:hypothetical protein